MEPDREGTEERTCSKDLVLHDSAAFKDGSVGAFVESEDILINEIACRFR